jgi:hypothetical protein
MTLNSRTTQTRRVMGNFEEELDPSLFEFEDVDLEDFDDHLFDDEELEEEDDDGN